MRHDWKIGLVTLAMILLTTVGAAIAQEEDAGVIPETAVAQEEEDAGIIPGAAEGLAPAIATLLIFVILVWVLGRFAWGPIVSGLKAREEHIRKEIADAEAARARAEQTLGEYRAQLAKAEEQVRELIAKATADGERAAAGIRTHAQQEAEQIKERALRDIEASKNQAIAEIYENAAELATQVAERILRRNLNAEDQRDLVTRSLEQLETMKS